MTAEKAVGTALQEVLDEAAMAHTVARMAAEILERDGDSLMLVGIHTRGIPLADRLARAFREATGRKVPVGRLDITLYRDDVGPWRPAHQQPVLKKTVLPDSIDDHVVYLVDDVLFTGRTIRAALDTLVDYGRPLAVRLAVLIDRGHRDRRYHP
jgi:pyrimidine operon attenuation protein/uracil phosphoribosyltransferase